MFSVKLLGKVLENVLILYLKLLDFKSRLRTQYMWSQTCYLRMVYSDFCLIIQHEHAKKSVKWFERSNRLDTALYKNYLFYALLW